MFQIEKIEESEAHKKLEEFLRSRDFLPIFFYSPHTLNTWLAHDGKSLYIARFGEERILLTYKDKENEVRFLYDEPSKQIVAGVAAHFNPVFISANELVKKDPAIAAEKEYFEIQQLIIDIDQTLELKDGKIRRDYRNCQTKHPNLVIEDYSKVHDAEIDEFLKIWNGVRGETENKHARTQNDRRFIALYGKAPEANGFVVKDGQKIVAISFFVSAMDGKAMAVLSKCLRGYTQLGVFIFIERLRRMQNAGFKQVYIGPINNDFKKRFIGSGKIQEVYCHDIYRAPDFEVRRQYALRIF